MATRKLAVTSNGLTRFTLTLESDRAEIEASADDSEKKIALPRVVATLPELDGAPTEIEIGDHRALFLEACANKRRASAST